MADELVPLEIVVNEFFTQMVTSFDFDCGFCKFDDGLVGEGDQGFADVLLEDLLALVDAVLRIYLEVQVFLQVLQVVLRTRQVLVDAQFL